MNATAKLVDPLKIKWRGHPVELEAHGKAPALRYDVSVHNFRHGGVFGIFYGGTLREKVKAPKDATAIVSGAPSLDYHKGYENAKARAQELAISWFDADKASDAKLAAEQKSAAEAKLAAEKKAEERAADKAEALRLADAIDRSACVAPDTAKKLAALVTKLFGKAE